MASDTGSSKNDWAGIVKWLVIGLVTITALFLFKGEIGGVLERAENIEISSSGLKIKTTQTLLGQVEVSGVKLKASNVIGTGIQGNSYVSPVHNFQIAWSGNGNWSASDTEGRLLMQQLGLPASVDIPLVIRMNEMVGNFYPNVNVAVESIGGISANDYINLSAQTLQAQGWQILTKEVDDSTQGGFISFYNTSNNAKLYQFQRVVIDSGKAFIITASQLPLDDYTSQQLREELLFILNSFRIINHIDQA